jgi:hypothetical protein
MAPTAVNFRSTQSQLIQSARAGGRGDTLIPHGDGGKLEIFHMKYTSPASGGPAATNVISMGYLPQGLLIPHLTSLICSDFGSTTTIDVGLNEYKKNNGTLVAAAPEKLWDNLDVSGAAVNTTLAATGVAAVKNSGLLLDGFAEVIVTLASAGMQAAATLDLFFVVARGN